MICARKSGMRTIAIASGGCPAEGKGGLARALAFLGVLLVAAPSAMAADGPARIGKVDTTFKLLGRNDRIVVDRYDDPRVDGVSCYMSRAETGGIKGSLGLATDPSRFSIACRATGRVTIRGKLPDNEVVFGASANWLFKEIRVSRLWDADKHVLVYLVWSTQALTPEGSPYNAITAVPVDVP
jgi:CreA protein